MSYDTRLMVKVCNLYYKDNLTQDKIAKKLKISKYQVNRILKKAIGLGIVQINIIDPTASVSNLEEELEKRFDLKRALVVENYGLSDVELKSKLGQAAAGYLLEIIKDGDVIGVSWGTTVNEVINHLPSRINKKVEVVQITGGSHYISVNINCHDVARRFASRFGTEPHLLFAPAVVDSENTKDLLLKETSIKKTFEYFDRVTIAIVGIGALYPRIVSTLIETGSISQEDLKSLKESRAVGDILSHFFDIEGKMCNSSLNKRLIAMPIDDLLKIPYSLGVAGGELKAEAILGAIRGRYVNILVTDSKAAERILKLSHRS